VVELTFAMIKPDAIKAKNSGKIIDLIEKNGFEIIFMEKMQFGQEDAELFYQEHNKRPFFGELVEFMTSGPIIAMVLEKENAIADFRKLMGDTDPAKAESGTIRKLFGTSIGNNAVHGSDSAQSAERELGLFFPCPDDECEIEVESEEE
jgi:nucleoside-diphosphate kinase